MEKKRIYVMSDDSMTNEIINIKYKRLMTQKKKNQNEQEVKTKATKSRRKSSKKEINPQNVDYVFKKKQYRKILLMRI